LEAPKSRSKFCSKHAESLGVKAPVDYIVSIVPWFKRLKITFKMYTRKCSNGLEWFWKICLYPVSVIRGLNFGRVGPKPVWARVLGKPNGLDNLVLLSEEPILSPIIK
jgi:hypothetical protein